MSNGITHETTTSADGTATTPFLMKSAHELARVLPDAIVTELPDKDSPEVENESGPDRCRDRGLSVCLNTERARRDSNPKPSDP